MLVIFPNITELSVVNQNLFIVVSEFAVFNMQLVFLNFQKDPSMH